VSIAGTNFIYGSWTFGNENESPVALVGGSATGLSIFTSLTAGLDADDYLTISCTNASVYGASRALQLVMSGITSYTEANFTDGDPYDGLLYYTISGTSSYAISPGTTSIDAEGSLTSSAEVTAQLDSTPWADGSTVYAISSAEMAGTITYSLYPAGS
jgi:hypothetical protein